MKLVGSMEQSIYVNGSIANSDDFKDEFVDKILEIRDKVDDEYGKLPFMGMSRNTFIWFKGLFSKDMAYVETTTNTLFWLMDVRLLDMRDGLFDFYLED